MADYFDIIYNGNMRLAKWKPIDFLVIDHDLKLQYNKVLSERVVILSDVEDKLVWTKNISGKYIVRDGYNSLMKDNDHPAWLYKLFWHSACLPKAGAFAWLAVQDRVLTGMRLDRLGITVAFTCVLCNKHLESSSHLFLHCDFAYQCSLWFFDKLNLTFVMENDLITFFSSWPLLFTSSFYACIWIISPSILLWNIWLERNNRIFRNTSSSLPEVLIKIELSISEVALSHICRNLDNLTSFSHWDSRVTRVWSMFSALPSHGSILRKGVVLNKRKLASWKPPPLGKFKLNFDGASRGNPGLAGVGMVIFDHHT